LRFKQESLKSRVLIIGSELLMNQEKSPFPNNLKAPFSKPSENRSGEMMSVKKPDFKL